MARPHPLHRTAEHDAPTELLGHQSLADATPARPTRREARSARRRRPPTGVRRPISYLAAAAAGAVIVGVVATNEPAAQAEATGSEPVSVAEQLELEARSAGTLVDAELPDRLGELAATRSQRETELAAAAQAQAAADQAAIEARLAAEAKAAEEARLAAEARAAEEARLAAEARAAEEARRAEARAAEQAASSRSSSGSGSASGSSSGSSRSGSFQDYALSKLGGDSSQFSCLENLWGKESGWNPNAQNPTSTAYGIPQFLNSTWAGTGIAKTSDGYRQIDAGLIYIESRYGSPCSAWAHSKANNWY